MNNTLKQTWWSLLLRGLVAILFALLILFAPGLTIATGAISFIVLFSAATIIEGIVIIVGSVLRREGQWFLMLIVGIISLVAGLLALANPLFVAFVSVRLMVAILVFKLLVGGLAEIVLALQIRTETEEWGWVLLNGALALIFGLILLARPITALEVLVLMTAFYFLAAGVVQLILAFKVRGLANVVAEVQAKSA